MNIICKQCRKPAKVKGTKIVFCNRECYHKSREGIFTCDNCSKVFKHFKSHKKGKLVFCSSKCQQEKMVASLHSNWRGGKSISAGYYVLYMPDHPNAVHNKILEHRYVMEQHIGRLLTKDEIVHHINEDKKDNRIENLMIMSRSEHKAHHHDIPGKWARLFDECIRCGTNNRKHSGAGLCSRCYNREKFPWSKRTTKTP